MDKPAPATIGILDQFQTELVATWRRVPNKGLFFALLAAWLALFQFLGNSTFGYFHSASLFDWMGACYTTHLPDGSLTDDSVGLWVPVVVLGLFWLKRKEFEEMPLRLWWPGLLLLGCGILIHIVGYLIQQPRASILAMFVGIYGLMGLAWGPECLRRSFFPFFLFAFCIPFSGPLDFITFRLRLLSCQLVAWVCHMILAIDVVQDGTILRDPGNRYQYEVAAACSGIRSLVAIGLMATIGAFLYFRTWWRRLLLILAAGPLAVLGNSVRLLMIIITAEIWGQQWGNYVHEGGPARIISLLPYVLAFLGLLALGKFLDEGNPPNPKPV